MNPRVNEILLSVDGTLIFTFKPRTGKEPFGQPTQADAILGLLTVFLQEDPKPPYSSLILQFKTPGPLGIRTYRTVVFSERKIVH